MLIDAIDDPIIEFIVWVIAHRLYQLSWLNSVPCVVVDLGYKIVKKDRSYDLVEL